MLTMRPAQQTRAPNFHAMFHDASQRKFDVLLFWALGRLSREGVPATLQHLNRTTSYGIGYRSNTEQYFDSCGIFRDAVVAIIASVAKQERVLLSQRVRAGLDKARSQGRKLGRPRVTVDAAHVCPPARVRGFMAEDCGCAGGQHWYCVSVSPCPFKNLHSKQRRI